MLGQLYIGLAFMLLSQPSRRQTTRPSAVFCRAAAFAETRVRFVAHDSIPSSFIRTKEPRFCSAVFYFGAWSPGDASHSLMRDPVSASWALRISVSRSAPGGSDFACSRNAWLRRQDVLRVTGFVCDVLGVADLLAGVDRSRPLRNVSLN